jgi:putative membrane protein
MVTWFAGLFYLPRLFIYNTEANLRPEEERKALQGQFSLMIKRLWLGITWPSAILTIIFGGWMAYLYGSVPLWLKLKLALVSLLYVYHFSLHKLYLEQKNGLYKYSSDQLRVWNEVATIFLVTIVLLVSVKDAFSPLWGIISLIILISLLILGIKMYKKFRAD